MSKTPLSKLIDEILLANPTRANVKEINVRRDRFEIVISGPSACGKTRLARAMGRLLREYRVDRVVSVNTDNGEHHVEFGPET